MTPSDESEVLVFLGFSLDPRQRTLFGPDGQPVPLTGRAFETLLFLARHPNRILDKQTLMKAVWPNAIVEENNLNQNILIVRRALGEVPGEHRFIITVPGRGFQFAPAVTRRGGAATPDSGRPPGADRPATDPVVAPPPDRNPSLPAVSGAPKPASVARGGAGGTSPWVSLAAVLGTLAVLIAAGGSFTLRRLRAIPASVSSSTVEPASAAQAATPTSGGPSSVKSGTTASPASDVPRASVAVLPFDNLTGDPSKEYFSDGMAEELINALAHVPDLKVPARVSSFAYKGRHTDIRAIARDLGVATLLEGSVRSAGDRIRVTVQLVDAGTGYNLFSQTYDRRFADIFSLQRDLANSIVTTLRGDLIASAPARDIAGPPTEDVEAYHLYLQGVHEAPLGTEAAIRLAISFLDRALARDPGFAAALSARAVIRPTLVQAGFPEPKALDVGERDARKALTLDPNSVMAQGALGEIAALRGDWAAADRAYRAGIKTSPTEPLLHANLEFFVEEQTGHLHEARIEAGEAARLAPGNSFIAFGPPVVDYLTGGLDAEAVRGADFAVGLGLANLAPLPLIYTFAASRTGHFAEAAHHAADSLTAEVRNGGGAAALDLAFAALSDPAKGPAARDALAGLVRRFGVNGIDPISRTLLVNLFTMLGSLDQAYDLANRSLDASLGSGTFGSHWGALWIPEMRPFRRDPRFQRLATRLKMPDYWAMYGPPDGCELKDQVLRCQ